MFTPFAFSAGLMLSPDILTVVGNLAGERGLPFLLLLGGAVFCHAVTSRIYRKAGLDRNRDHSGGTELIRGAMGPVWALVFSLFPRMAVFVCLSTSVLATAGYVFNEVFVFWFPNMGFSLLLLAFLLALNLMGRGPANVVQVILVSFSVLGLLVLTLVGFATFDPSGSEAFPAAGVGHGALGAMFFPLMIFIGFELALFSSKEETERPAQVRSMLFAVVGIGLLLGAWGFVSLAHVAPERLAGSTLPHALAARIIMGQSGRMLIGAVVICGACAAVNVLLASLSRLMEAMAQDGLLPKALVQVRGRSLAPPFLLCGGVFVMMLAGMAGSPVISHLNLAGAWFWLASYGAINLSFLKTMGARAHGPAWVWKNITPALSLLSLLLIGVSLGAVFFTLEMADSVNMLKALIPFMAVSVGCSAAIVKRDRL